MIIDQKIIDSDVFTNNYTGDCVEATIGKQYLPEGISRLYFISDDLVRILANKNEIKVISPRIVQIKVYGRQVKFYTFTEFQLHDYNKVLVKQGKIMNIIPENEFVISNYDILRVLMFHQIPFAVKDMKIGLTKMELIIKKNYYLFNDEIVPSSLRVEGAENERWYQNLFKIRPNS